MSDLEFLDYVPKRLKNKTDNLLGMYTNLLDKFMKGEIDESYNFNKEINELTAYWDVVRHDYLDKAKEVLDPMGISELIVKDTDQMRRFLFVLHEIYSAKGTITALRYILRVVGMDAEVIRWYHEDYLKHRPTVEECHAIITVMIGDNPLTEETMDRFMQLSDLLMDICLTIPVWYFVKNLTDDFKSVNDVMSEIFIRNHLWDKHRYFDLELFNRYQVEGYSNDGFGRGIQASTFIPNYHYLIGDVVFDRGVSYSCIKDHISPVFIKSYWEQILSWRPLTRYTATDIVSQTGRVYKSLRAHVSSAFFASGVLGSTYKSNRTYREGDIIFYERTRYVCVEDHISQAGFDEEKWAKPDYWEPWKKYLVREIYYFDNKRYRSLVTHQAGDTFNPDYWMLDTTWEEGKPYELHAIVYINGIEYVNTVEGTIVDPRLDNWAYTSIPDNLLWEAYTTWRPNTQYYPGMVVFYQGIPYSCYKATSSASFQINDWNKVQASEINAFENLVKLNYFNDKRRPMSYYRDTVGIEFNFQGRYGYNYPGISTNPNIRFLDTDQVTRYECGNCGYLYDPIPNGRRPFLELPVGWTCPACQAKKANFVAVEENPKPGIQATIAAFHILKDVSKIKKIIDPSPYGNYPHFQNFLQKLNNLVPLLPNFTPKQVDDLIYLYVNIVRDKYRPFMFTGMNLNPGVVDKYTRGYYEPPYHMTGMTGSILGAIKYQYPESSPLCTVRYDSELNVSSIYGSELAWIWGHGQETYIKHVVDPALYFGDEWEDSLDPETPRYDFDYRRDVRFDLDRDPRKYCEEHDLKFYKHQGMFPYPRMAGELEAVWDDYGVFFYGYVDSVWDMELIKTAFRIMVDPDLVSKIEDLKEILVALNSEHIFNSDDFRRLLLTLEDENVIKNTLAVDPGNPDVKSVMDFLLGLMPILDDPTSLSKKNAFVEAALLLPYLPKILNKFRTVEVATPLFITQGDQENVLYAKISMATWEEVYNLAGNILYDWTIPNREHPYPFVDGGIGNAGDILHPLTTVHFEDVPFPKGTLNTLQDSMTYETVQHLVSEIEYEQVTYDSGHVRHELEKPVFFDGVPVFVTPWRQSLEWLIQTAFDLVATASIDLPYVWDYLKYYALRFHNEHEILDDGTFYLYHNEADDYENVVQPIKIAEPRENIRASFRDGFTCSGLIKGDGTCLIPGVTFYQGAENYLRRGTDADLLYILPLIVKLYPEFSFIKEGYEVNAPGFYELAKTLVDSAEIVPYQVKPDTDVTYEFEDEIPIFNWEDDLP